MTQPPPPGWQPPPEQAGQPVPWGQQWGPPSDEPAPAAAPAQPAYPPQQPGPNAYYQQPGQPPWQQQWQQQWQPAWGLPVHKPGIVALRPLRLGDLYDGAFKAIRQNPLSMIGTSLVVKTIFVAIPAVVTAILTINGSLDLRLPRSGGQVEGGLDTVFSGGEVARYAGSIFGSLAGLVLIGLIVNVVFGAVVGRRTGPRQAWLESRGRIPALLGVVLLNFVILYGPTALVVALVAIGFVASVPIGLMVVLLLMAVAAVVAYYLTMLVKLRFAYAVVVLERLGPLASIGRSFQLTRGSFWRILGISLLTMLMVGIAGTILGIPFAVLGTIGPLAWPDSQLGGVLGVAGSYLSAILVGSIVTPFTASVSVLQYLDQRIRLEGYDVQLIAAAQDPTRQAPQQSAPHTMQ